MVMYNVVKIMITNVVIRVVTSSSLDSVVTHKMSVCSSFVFVLLWGDTIDLRDVKQNYRGH